MITMNPTCDSGFRVPQSPPSKPSHALPPPLSYDFSSSSAMQHDRAATGFDAANAGDASVSLERNLAITARVGLGPLRRVADQFWKRRLGTGIWCHRKHGRDWIWWKLEGGPAPIWIKHGSRFGEQVFCILTISIVLNTNNVRDIGCNNCWQSRDGGWEIVH